MTKFLYTDRSVEESFFEMEVLYPESSSLSRPMKQLGRNNNEANLGFDNTGEKWISSKIEAVRVSLKIMQKARDHAAEFGNFRDWERKALIAQGIQSRLDKLIAAHLELHG